MPYNNGVSVSGLLHVFLIVGINATKSILTAIMTDAVGSLVSIHGIIPSKAMTRKYVSILRIFLKPYWSENKKIMIVKISDAAVGKAPIPAPRANWPKNTIHEAIDQTSHV